MAKGKKRVADDYNEEDEDDEDDEDEEGTDGDEEDEDESEAGAGPKVYHNLYRGPAPRPVRFK